MIVLFSLSTRLFVSILLYLLAHTATFHEKGARKLFAFERGYFPL